MAGARHHETSTYLLNNHANWRIERTARGLEYRRALTPERLLLLSFFGLIAVGTLGFKLLPGLYVDRPLSWLDALFTATSAVCVTGLIVVDTATYFTPLGQGFLLMLIQLGGLGILTLTTIIIVSLGKRLSLHHEAVTASIADISPDVDFRQLATNIVVVTLLVEVVGAAVLTVAWLPRFGPGEAAWHAVFQSVSAFCNAGFSTFSDSLMGFRTSPVTLVTIMALILLGGIGFLTIEELRLRLGKGDPRSLRLSLHSRLALAATALLLVGGWVVFTVLEWSHTLGDLPSWARLMNGMFMSVTARTAGFNTVDYGATAPSSSFLTILLMSIGGSPGSTAGGLKTTTAAVIVLLAYTRLRGRSITGVWYRSIPTETVQRAVGLFVVGFLLVTGAILLYTVLQLPPTGTAGGSFLSYMFEAVSAFNTVGLSMGATGELTDTAKLLTIFLMYVGRVGSLSFASALALKRSPEGRDFRYAYEDVILG